MGTETFFIENGRRTCYPTTVANKIQKLGELRGIVDKTKREGKKVVFTNGCFDLLHRGHLQLLREAKKSGDLLIVALNSDSSVKKIKGPSRPIFSQAERAELIAALEMVDYVAIFDEADPRSVIKTLKPDVLVKGGDWKEKIVGREIVEENGGKVISIPYLEGYSTTRIIERMGKK